uniref:NADH-ubiquinone oxidoreductase chain 2 n=1 Tax=Anthonomus eugenii TaxID=122869 RepID=A0A5B8ZWZ3_9CUCU|nr:NADH dehydrogenase subunit 2 [Anthonomus eugenii]QED57244.1 NADH dehydrogenase subunit 2 [Anthonomus eugenii]QED57251.1 NADH dehydrogenase subunit 2 [Anthonomus eugenii]QED57252.1 NADH dehydrogenase subunit 2 [Anthonomus eugenii]QED57259.1 NADH dehydrogenase subunit 2 [Anthonomus eugenii]
MNKIMFYSTLIMSSIMAISGTSWLTIWIGLEMNLLSIMPIMKDKLKSTSEAMIKYFMVQAMASTILLFSILMFQLASTKMMSASTYFILNSALFMKMGAAPLHFWYPEVLSGLSWKNNFIMLTWQKIAPMLIIINTSFSILFISLFIVFSALLGSLQGFNQICLRKILAYSSINHIGWMLASFLCTHTIWLFYYLIYTLINMNIIIILQKMNIFYMNQINKLFSFNLKMKMMYMLNFLSLSGLPPFLGFIPKWLVVNFLIMNNFLSLSLILIIFTLLALFMYFRITFSTFSFFYSKNILNYKNKISYTIFFINFLALSGSFIQILSINMI